MNKKGNMWFSLVIATFLYVSGVLFIPFLTDDITVARTNLNCESENSITGGVMLTCLLFSALTPYFIWFTISLMIGFFVGGNQ